MGFAREPIGSGGVGRGRFGGGAATDTANSCDELTYGTHTHTHVYVLLILSSCRRLDARILHDLPVHLSLNSSPHTHIYVIYVIYAPR